MSDFFMRACQFIGFFITFVCAVVALDEVEFNVRKSGHRVAISSFLLGAELILIIWSFA